MFKTMTKIMKANLTASFKDIYWYLLKYIQVHIDIKHSCFGTPDFLNKDIHHFNCIDT